MVMLIVMVLCVAAMLCHAFAMHGEQFDNPTTTLLANLGAWLREAKSHSHAAKAGEILSNRFPTEPFATAIRSNVDTVLADLAQRYRTPIPEAYLSENIARALGQRRQHGIFYTPWPLAQYLTRSAAELLAREFPNESPTWLDPACGGGVFFQSLLSDDPKAPGDFLGLENSPVATALCQAIAQARRFEATGRMKIECRNALLCSPDELFQGRQTAPLVVVGNPPYSNFGKRALSSWLDQELLRYRSRSGEKKTNLRDAFLLFLRLAESLIAARGRGVLAMVLSTTFLDAITHAHVRSSLLSTFDELHILRLESPEESNSNLFSIRQPTAACLFVRQANHDPKSPAKVFQAILNGAREQKVDWLANHTAHSTDWREIAIESETSERGNKAWSETPTPPKWYSAAPSLPEIFKKYVSGVQTKNDAIFLARSRSKLEEQIRTHFGAFDPSYIQTILVGPFDPWWIYYDPSLLGRARYPVMRHMLKENLGLVFMRQATSVGEYDHFLVTRNLVTDRIFHSRWGAPFLAPLYQWNEDERVTNLNESAPEDWLAFSYAIMHSRWYRESASAALRTDFPRIPRREFVKKGVAKQLTQLGQELIELHAPKAGWRAFNLANERESNFVVEHRYPRVQPFCEMVQVFVASGVVLAEVPMEAWNFRIGGVEVLRRFLMRRRGTALLNWEVAHFQEAIRVLTETNRLRLAIDSTKIPNSSASGIIC